jgi:hypothetical protein
MAGDFAFSKACCSSLSSIRLFWTIDNGRYLFFISRSQRVCFEVSSVQKESNRVPTPWGDDMEEAQMAQAEAIRTKTISAPRAAVYPGVDLLLSLGCG